MGSERAALDAGRAHGGRGKSRRGRATRRCAQLLGRTSGGAPAPRRRAGSPSSGAGPAAWRSFLARPPAGPHPRGVRPPSPGEQDCAVLQRVAAHRPPALPDQLGFRALHTRSGTREARLGPSGCGHRHCTCRAISGVTRTTWHPLRLLHLGWARSSHLYFPALGRGAPALLAPLWRF